MVVHDVAVLSLLLMAGLSKSLLIKCILGEYVLLSFYPNGLFSS